MLTDVNREFPRLKLDKPVEMRELIDFVQSRSGFGGSDVVGMVYALNHAILHFMRQSVPVRLDGIGIFRPTIKLDGSIQVRFLADKLLVRELNQKNRLKNRITNQKNVGKSLKELQSDAQPPVEM